MEEYIMLNDITVDKITDKFSNKDFWNFIFETVFGSIKETSTGINYIEKYNSFIYVFADELVSIINMHIRHSVPITRKDINSFVLNLIDGIDQDVKLTGMKSVRVQMINSYLYDLVFESTWKYFYKGIKKN